LFARLLTLADVAPKPLKSQSLLRQRSVRLFTFGGVMVLGLWESQSLLRQRSVPWRPKTEIGDSRPAREGRRVSQISSWSGGAPRRAAATE